MSRVFAFVACLALTGLAFSASAAPITWTLHDVTFDDGGTASGSFVFDADLLTFGAIDITTTDTADVTGAHYAVLDPPFPPRTFFDVFLPGLAADLTGMPGLELAFSEDMTDAGGTIALDVNSDFSFEFVCTTANCILGEETREVVRGFIEASPAVVVTPPVPEPATASILLAGLFGLGRRRARQAARN